jgi:hypothetical protein
MPHNLLPALSPCANESLVHQTDGETNRPQIQPYRHIRRLNAYSLSTAILIVASSVFKNGVVVTEIQQAHELLTAAGHDNAVDTAIALCAGQSSTLTGTLAGQIVMEGFLSSRFVQPGDHATDCDHPCCHCYPKRRTRFIRPLILSQVILSPGFRSPSSLLSGVRQAPTRQRWAI